jgi:hypothetical protein
VERINQFDLYEVAKQLSPFVNLRADQDVPTKTVFWPMWTARDALQSLLKGKPCSLGISKGKCQSALKGLVDIEEQYFTRVEPDGTPRWKFPEEGDDPVPGYMVRHALEEIGKFETVFAEELREEATYRVPSRGIFSIPKLVDSAHESFPKDLLPYLSDKARGEWCAAGRCLAFNLLSASGFHVARAVESVMQDYYQHFVGKDPTKLKTWHEYISDIEPKATDDKADLVNPSKKTVTELKQMKDDYRNPIMHPRIVLDEADARMLFANGEAAIIAMALEMKTRFGHVGPPSSATPASPAKGKKGLAAASTIAGGGTP